RQAEEAALLARDLGEERPQLLLPARLDGRRTFLHARDARRSHGLGGGRLQARRGGRRRPGLPLRRGLAPAKAAKGGDHPPGAQGGRAEPATAADSGSPELSSSGARSGKVASPPPSSAPPSAAGAPPSWARGSSAARGDAGLSARPGSDSALRCAKAGSGP